MLENKKKYNMPENKLKSKISTMLDFVEEQIKHKKGKGLFFLNKKKSSF